MKLSTAAIKDRASAFLQRFFKASVPLFLLFLIGIYGFLAWRIYTLNQIEPDPAVVAKELKTQGVPNIDPVALSKIQELEDNSVEVKTLFDEARSNPFDE
jgi:hypothetical protein